MLDEYKKRAEQIERIFEKAKHEALAVIATIEPEIQEIVIESCANNLVSIRAAAEHLGISESQLRALEKRGLVPAYRPGGVLRFDLAELRQAVRSQKPNLSAVR
jgi:excisionase family DNA binding protein